MEVNEALVKHVAHLAKLSFKEEEMAEITAKFESIIKMVDELEELDTSAYEARAWGNELNNVMRSDDESWVVDREVLLNNAPTARDGFIEVPTVIDESGDNA